MHLLQSHTPAGTAMLLQVLTWAIAGRRQANHGRVHMVLLGLLKFNASGFEKTTHFVVKINCMIVVLIQSTVHALSCCTLWHFNSRDTLA